MCCSFSSLHAEDIVLHGVQGFTLHYAIAKIVTSDKDVLLFSGLTGAIAGILPDAPPSNSKLYFQFHYGSEGMRIIPAWALHVFTDRLFHPHYGEGHWGEDWRLVTLDVVLWGVTIYFLRELMK
jgi:hypothetical protein